MRVPSGSAPSTTTPEISWPSTDPGAAPPRRSFSTSLPQSPHARTRTRTPPGGVVGEGSSRSAGDPPGVTVTASMSPQSLGALGSAGLAQGELRDLGADRIDERLRRDPEHRVGRTGGSPDVLVGEQVGIAVD